MERKILLIDDHAVVRGGLRAALAAAIRSSEIFEAATARDGIRMIEQEPYDVVILDLTLPDMNGIEALKSIRGLRPKMPVIIFSMHSDREYCLRCLKAGARGYVTKDGAAEEITQAVSAVLAGRRYVARHLADHLMGMLLEDDGRPPHHGLSDREFEVLCLLGSGKTVSEIGLHLCLSVKTVSTYRARLLEKLSLDNNAQIMRYTLEHGLVPAGHRPGPEN